jgi:aminoglycoside phosphotransferase (APT) family kinase protein
MCGSAGSTVRLARWCHEHLGTEPAISIRRLAAGRSNLTYEVSDVTGRRVVLRRPPFTQAVRAAHDVLREHQVLSALAATDVPTPRPLAACSDDDVLGAPFFVMEWIDGIALEDPDSASQLSLAARRRVGEELAEILAQVHRLDPQRVGLGAFVRPEPYLDRELRRWTRQWTLSRDGTTDPFIRAAALLAERSPSDAVQSPVHGDAHLRNVLVSPDGEIRALLDWEMSTIGSPGADLGLALIYWAEPDDEIAPIGPMASQADGFVDRSQLAAHYVQSGGPGGGDLDFHVAFGTWKLAAILDSVIWRERAGGYGLTDEPVDLAPMQEASRRLAEHAERLARRL